MAIRDHDGAARSVRSSADGSSALLASVCPFAEILLQDEHARFNVHVEVEEILKSLTKQRFDDGSAAIASLDPDDLRRRTKQERPRVKIRVLRHDDETMVAGILPNGTVAGTS